MPDAFASLADPASSSRGSVEFGLTLPDPPEGLHAARLAEIFLFPRFPVSK
ncbi:hypothetical protein U8326_15470 [Tsuneonella sp. CC-YZS046]|uniref:hypothetical protein n=1 Tax=Tsuneonella sp. CC-YZS046 TaxID=3042152 RepID=UPI002D787F27|nr:hypothetical protein [Tsuneonella sp. CC-YZS046]WRO66414.1 hypothetical protein U8326_15470 [Tsuneonella sp. CC-YZS046]